MRQEALLEVLKKAKHLKKGRGGWCKGMKPGISGPRCAGEAKRKEKKVSPVSKNAGKGLSSAPPEKNGAKMTGSGEKPCRRG